MLNCVLLESNRIVTTWGEKTTITNANYLVVFEYLGRVMYCILKPASNATIQNDRYEEWLIEDVDGGDPENGQTDFKTAGAWTYSAYSQLSETNTDPEQSAELVEKGICNVTGVPIPEYSQQVTVNSYS